MIILSLKYNEGRLTLVVIQQRSFVIVIVNRMEVCLLVKKFSESLATAVLSCRVRWDWLNVIKSGKEL